MILRIGTFLQDRYEILEQIGTGGMSVVYKAKCHKLNRMVAVKVLKEEFANDSSFVSKFKMEAQAAAGLSHPNIVNIYDVIDEDTIHYIVMELIEGITLKSYIQKKSRLEVKESIGIAIQVAQGIAAAHEQNIIHRDIKPQNMMISRDGKVKVADFGIARGVSAQTLTSAAMGSVHYISPEQARGGYSDARSDIYSLGITLYEMITGKLPFTGDNTVSIALAHLEDPITPPSVYNPEIPIVLEQLILKCTEKKPERRFDNAGQVIAELRKVLLQPEYEFIKPESMPAAEDENKSFMEGATIAISGDELNQIKEGKRTGQEEAGDRRPAEVMHSAPKKEKPAVRKKPRREDDVNSNLERLFASAGIVAAVIIVVVLVVLISKLTGMFQSGFLGREQSTANNVQQQGTDPSLNGQEVYMPKVSGLSAEEAKRQLKAAGLVNVKYVYDYFDEVESDYVAAQSPAEGTLVQNEQITLTISNGSDKIDLSKLVLEDMDISTAKKMIESYELVVETAAAESDTVKAGNVVRAEPSKAAKGETVVLYVSTGPHIDLVTIPDIKGKTEDEAIAMLTEAGLTPENTGTEHSDTVGKGMVINYSGGTDGQIEPGGTISYIISSGSKQQRYVASINDKYDLSSLIGPGAGSSNATLMIRLHQVAADGSDIYKTLTDTVTITGSVILPISYTSIESMNGTDEGEIEVVDVESGAVLKTYPLAFFPMD